MNPTTTPTLTPDAGATRSEAVLPEVLAQLEALRRENEALGRDLLRCYEQLSLVFDITEHIARLREPRDVEHELLKRFAIMLSAGATFLVVDGQGHRVDDDSAPGRIESVDTDEVLRLLDEDIRAVTSTGHASMRPLFMDRRGATDASRFIPTPSGMSATPTYFALVSAFRRAQASPATVISLRRGTESPFDAGDLLASESALGYGSHVLGNLLMMRHLQQMAFETTCAMVRAIDQKDNYTSGHSERVGWLAKLTGMALGLGDADLQTLEWAGLLHDVGKIGVPESILNKPGKLTPEEWEIMKKHPRMSYEVLKPVRSLSAVLGGVLYHHENHDGTGYPEGLSGEQIPLFARIIHVVDIFDALTSTRSYRSGFSMQRAFSILADGSGTVTDPHVTRKFIESFKQYIAAQPEDFARRFHSIRRAEEPATEK